jgi:pimeloyl-ACP methyl ester carboxylesterase
MPVKRIRGVDLVYEVIGDSGPFVTVTPGGRRGIMAEEALATLIAEAGYRVLLHDRRNVGASGIALAGDNESLEQAHDLHLLLQELAIGPAYVCGCSSGARMSLLLARHHPNTVKALLLWRVTGGPHAAKRLAWNYYEQFLEAAAQGGIEAVCQTEHFAAMIQANPVNRETLVGMGTEKFVACMQRWLAGFNQDSGHPVAGISPAELRAMTVPAMIVPGNDLVHLRAAGQAAHRLLPNSTYREILSNDVDADVDFTGWEAKTGTLAAAFIDFLRQRERG